MTTVQAWLDAVDPVRRAMIERLRSLALAAHPGTSEQIKWNAPSICVGGDDRITMGIEAKGGVRVVLHRGAKPKDSLGFVFADPDGLAKWPAVDRGVIRFATEADIIARTPAIAALFARWLEVTA
jgi:hypothetical protein